MWLEVTTIYYQSTSKLIRAFYFNFIKLDESSRGDFICNKISNSMRAIILFIGLIGYSQLLAQENSSDAGFLEIWEAGVPFITAYSPEDYKAHIQNWCFMQDENGIMYVGNTSGVLEFDGVSWRLISLANGSPAKSLARSDDRRIYVGGVRDMGYLEPDSTGQMQFQSLLSKLDTAYRNFADIWFTYAVRDTIYFISDTHIFRWHDDSFRVWEPQETFGFAFNINGDIYVDNRGVGMMRLQRDSLVLVPDGEEFSEGGVTTMLPYKDGRILVAHFNNGLFLYNHHEFTPFKKDEKTLLVDKSIYTGSVLQNGDYAFTTAGNGCFVINEDGDVKLWLGKQRGLTSDILIGSYVDREGSLWLATENGINRIEISLPLRVFNQQSGLTEGIDVCVYHNNKLYAATNIGLFYLKEVSMDSERKDFQFQKIDGIDQQIWDIIAKGNYLLAGNFNGLYQIDRNHRVRRLIQENTNDLCPSLIDPHRVYAGATTGKLFILKFENNQWGVEESNLHLEGRIVKIEENPDGSLWISTRYNGLYKLDWSPSNARRTFDEDYALIHYDTLHGLPELSYNAVFNANTETYVSTRAGIFRFDSVTQKFTLNEEITGQVNTPSSSFENIIKASVDGDTWITHGSNVINYVYKYKAGVLREVTACRRFSDFAVYDIYEKQDLVLFSGPKGTIIYNQQLGDDSKTLPSVNLRRVTNNDSLIFGGHSVKQPENSPVKLPFRKNALRFAYALADYDNPKAHQYQYLLEGFDQQWSSWSGETQRDFTNLTEGDYRLRVRGKNVFGQISNEATYVFAILPPWYRSWWAYAIYVLVAGSLIGFIVQWRSSQLRREKQALERIVKQRTEEVTQKNHQLAHQTKQLRELDHLKSHFFANISHEFRTPLSLIKGPIDQFVSDDTPLSPSDGGMIQRNANRLLRLVNQMLDLSKLDAGNLNLEPEPGDVYRFLRALSAAFSSHAEQRDISYYIQIPLAPLFISFDKDKLEKIAYNLLSNAFKFTSKGGNISIRADYQESIMTLQVKDNGNGIAADRLPQIFDRFYQIDAGATREHEGTGIGLALCKELVELMGGEITAQSEPGKGTILTVSLPFPKVENIESHLAENDEFAVPGFAAKDIAQENGEYVPDQEAVVVLVVEDNADMRSFIRAQLCDDYKILEASHGKIGLSLAQEEIPDLIITDLMMPQMDGMALCGQLKGDERTSHIPVIMLTAKAGQEHKIEGLETGADEYLTKPFDRHELQVRVKNLIAQRQQLRQRFSREIILEPKQISLSSLDEQFLQKVLDLLERNYAEGEFGISEMQDALAMSKTQLHRKMKALTDEAPGEFIRNYRLKRAAQILSQHSNNVTEIAYSVGFSSLSYFIRCFKNLYGVTPLEYAAQSSN